MDKYEMAEKLQSLLEFAETDMVDIPGYEEMYAVTKSGKVWSYYSKRYLSPGDNGHGYMYVSLHKDSKKKSYRLHRLVAEAFIEKPDGWDESWDVAHLDDNRSNNCYWNLAWQTRKENMDTDHFRASREYYGPCPVRCVETGVEYATQKAAAQELGIHPKSISNVINGYQVTAGGYHWERLEAALS